MGPLPPRHGSDVGRRRGRGRRLRRIVVSDIPGSSLSSSAALEMASGMAITALGGTTISPSNSPASDSGSSTRSSAFPQGLWTSSSPPQGFGARQPSSTAAHSNCARPRCRLRSYRRAQHRYPSWSRRPEYAHRRAAGERVAAVLGVEALRMPALRRSQGSMLTRLTGGGPGMSSPRTSEPSQRSTPSMPVMSSPRTVDGRESRIAAFDFDAGPSTARSGRTRPNARGTPRRPHDRRRIWRRSDRPRRNPRRRSLRRDDDRALRGAGRPAITEPPAFHVVWPAGGARGTTLGVSITRSRVPASAGTACPYHPS